MLQQLSMLWSQLRKVTCRLLQDLVSRLLERKPARRLGMLSGRAGDIKKHKWFEGLDWEALEARKVEPQRKPKDDSSKRLKELTVGAVVSLVAVLRVPELWCTAHQWVVCTSFGWYAPRSGGSRTGLQPVASLLLPSQQTI